MKYSSVFVVATVISIINIPSVFADGNDTEETDLINDLIKTGQFTEDEAKRFVSETMPSESQDIISKHMQDVTNDVNLSNGLQSISDLSIALQLTKDNGVFAGENDYVAKSIQIGSTKDLCPENNCQFDIDDGKFRMNTYAKNERVLDGILKVTTTQGDSKVSKIFPINSDPKINEIRESSDGTTTEVLEGTIRLGDVSNADFCYDFDNATLKVVKNKAILTIEGNHSRGLSGVFC
jgi:hypothetical protein